MTADCAIKSQTPYSSIGEMFTYLGTESFIGKLLETVQHYSSLHSASVIIFHKDHAPRVLLIDVPEADEKVFQTTYMKGTYLLDPFYRLGVTECEGVYHLAEIAPEGFADSEYFQKYFAAAGIGDELCFVFQCDGGISGQFSLSREQNEMPFSSEELAKLKSLSPILTKALAAHINRQSNIFAGEETGDTPTTLQKRLDEFAKGKLTGREYQIVHLMLQGYSSKAIAHKLGISTATETTHRKNVYRKMKINSHAELLAMALEFLLDADTHN